MSSSGSKLFDWSSRSDGTMGYRVLLKQYMKQLREIEGTDFVEQFAKRRTMSKRDLGELRSLAAELTREQLEEGLTEQQK